MARKGGALKHLLFGAHPLTSELQQTWNQGLANHRGVDHVPAESETVDDVPGVALRGLQLFRGRMRDLAQLWWLAFTAGRQR